MKTLTSRCRRGVSALLLAGALLGGPRGAQAESANYALAARWHGYVNTNLSFSEFFQQNHTVAVRFMMQYPRGYEGPILAVNGTGTYVIGQGDYQDGYVPYHSSPRLVVRIAGEKATYTFSDDQVRRKWQHLAIVRTAELRGSVLGARYRLYLNGAHREKDYGGDLFVPVTSPGQPQGTLRFGATDPVASTARSQFYGFIDDVAVFDAALNSGLVSGLSQIARLFGGEPNLLAGYTFDLALPSGDPLPGKLTRWYEMRGPVSREQLSPSRISFSDSFFLPRPAQKAPLRLPFQAGEIWYVVQGWEGTASHHGYAVFCWDLVRGGWNAVLRRPVRLSAEDSKGEPVYASAPGRVVHVYDGGASDPQEFDDPNHVRVEHAPDEIGSYLHLRTGSVTELGIDDNGAMTVKVGQKLGEVGTNKPDNYHLHTGLRNTINGSSVTIPGEFSNYEWWDEDDYVWRFVERGVPQPGQFVRRPWWALDVF